MNILYVVPFDISPDSSAGAETVNIYINLLEKAGHKIRVISSSVGRYSSNNIEYFITKNNEDINKIDQLKKLLGWIFFPENKFLYKTKSSVRKQIFDYVLKFSIEQYKPDVIFFEGTPAILLIEKIKIIFPEAFCIASVHDISYQGSERRLNLETNLVKRILRKRYLIHGEKRELEALSLFNLIMPQNPENISILKKHKILENSHYFHLVPYYETMYKHNSLHNTNILFYGLMNRPENYLSIEWFAINVFPLLPKEFNLVIMGGKPDKSLKRIESDRIIVTGFLNEREVEYHFNNSFCMVVPLLYGSGIKTKVLSALKSGLPVISNNIGVEGINISHKVQYLHCETIDDYVKNINDLFESAELYENISEKSKKYMENNYNHEACARELLSTIKCLMI